MFPLIRLHRQALATLALFVFTVVPTGYVAWTAWTIRRPGHLHAVEAEIGRRLGLRVAVEGVAYPRPGEVVYRGIVFRQEEPTTKGLTEVARARRVRLRRSDRELTILTEGLRLRGESPRLAMAQVGALLQRAAGPAHNYERVNLTASTCDLDLGAENLRFDLREVAGTFQADKSAPTVTVSYRVAAKGSNPRCELTLVRDRKTEPVRTSVTMKSMEGLPLPARVLDLFFESADWLGTSARVEGTLALRQTGVQDWEAEFQGDLHDVDLGALVGHQFPSHRMSGLGHVAIKSARWADRAGQGYGWVEARGELTTGQGTIGLPLLHALATEMKFRLAPKLARLDTREEAIDFRTLGLSFAMNPDGELHFEGALGNEFAPDAVMAGPTTPLAYAPQGAANVRGLIKTLFPVRSDDPGLMVPLTSESRVLLCLPVPPELAAKPARGIEGN
jgi:hypothetical protein